MVSLGRVTCVPRWSVSHIFGGVKGSVAATTAGTLVEPLELWVGSCVEADDVVSRGEDGDDDVICIKYLLDSF